MGTAADLGGPVELAPRVWWVGSLIPGDDFQCHVYLIEQGDRSVLIDPGSALVAAEVIRKVDEVVGVAHVRWLVCSHADPDIIGAIPALVERGLHPSVAIVTHWRDRALLVHAGFPMPFWLIEEHGWQLPLVDRALRFVFTPYAHFAGSFCSFDESSGTLFSSDLFGGFTDDASLFAPSADYFDDMRSFHEHYMPSREVLAHAVAQLRNLRIRIIAPQHGQIIGTELVAPIMDRLAQLECGIYLLARDDPGLQFLLTANRTVRDVVDTLVEEAQFPAVVAHIAELATEHLAAERLELWARSSDTVLRFEEGDSYAGHADEPPADVLEAFSGVPSDDGPRMVVPLRSPTSTHVGGAAVLELAPDAHLDRATRALIDQIAGLVEVGLEREVLRRLADLDRAALYERATHDPLTGLYNRAHLTDAANALFAVDDRRGGGRMAALMIDIDHFKEVNDRYGHPVGDRVLQHVAQAVGRSVRPGDTVVRFGGEELLVLLSDVDALTAVEIAERVRDAAARPPEVGPAVTLSVGIARRRPAESCEALVARADEALYRAKTGGRDRVDVAG
jgi:diguanylate cyclase (GGDEF)-like protein